jgi:hypothetical protein
MRRGGGRREVGWKGPFSDLDIINSIVNIDVIA